MKQKIKKNYKIKIQDVDKILELDSKGVRVSDIAKMVDLTQQGVRYWLNKYSLKNENEKDN